MYVRLCVRTRARDETEDFGSRGPTCDQIFTMLEVRFIKIEKGLFCSSWPLLSHELFRFKKALALQKLFTKQCRGVRPPKPPQNGAYLETWNFFLIWPHSPAINSFSDSELIFGFYAPKNPQAQLFSWFWKKLGVQSFRARIGQFGPKRPPPPRENAHIYIYIFLYKSEKGGADWAGTHCALSPHPCPNPARVSKSAEKLSSGVFWGLKSKN